MIKMMRVGMLSNVNNDIKEGMFDILDKKGYYDDEMWLNICEELNIDIDDVEDEIDMLKVELDEYIDCCNFWDNPQIIEK